MENEHPGMKVLKGTKCGRRALRIEGVGGI